MYFIDFHCIKNLSPQC